MSSQLDRARELCAQLAESLEENDMEGVRSLFDDRMMKAPPQALLAAWTQAVAEAGAPLGKPEVSLEESGEGSVAIVTWGGSKASIRARVVLNAENRIAGLHFSPAVAAKDKEATRNAGARLSRSLTVLAPGYLLIPVALGVAGNALYGSLSFSAFALGIAGWIFALVLRQPIAFLVRAIEKGKRSGVMVLLSGPIEEVVRLVCILIVGRTAFKAFSLGLGWGTVEIGYALFQGFLTLALLRRDDPRVDAVQAQLMKGGPITRGPIFGLIERLGATPFHIGASLTVAFGPWNVLALMILHSTLNASVLWLTKKSLFWAEMVALLVGFGIFSAGILLWSRI